MSALYDSLDSGGIAMLESPTGTGKTLSIICSALQWIMDQKQRQPPKEPSTTHAGREDEPDWMRNFVVPIDPKKPSPPPLKELNKKKKKGLVGFGLENHPKKEKKSSVEKPIKGRLSVVELDEEEEFLVEDYESERKEEEEVSPKVFFSSRTHSQLMQFMEELRKTAFASQLKTVCLGSRKNLCINPEVRKLGSSNRINERCLELQKNRKDHRTTVSKVKVRSSGGKIQRTKVSCGCPMLSKNKLQKQFRDEAYELHAVDIEDLVHLGNKTGTCPYYGSRSMVPAADLVVLPYQSLLLKSARISLNLNLRNSVVIIDEAHNLADSLTSMYNSKITLSQVHSLLEMYFNRFRTRLGAGNRRYIQTLMVLTKAFLRYLENTSTVPLSSCGAETDPDKKPVMDASTTINEFLFSLDIDNINLIKLQHYVKESNIIYKVSGYGTKMASLQSGTEVGDIGTPNGVEGSIVSGFQALVGILLSLTYDDTDGRIIVSKQSYTSLGHQDDAYLKFVMLAGERIFSEIEELGRLVCNLVTVVPEGIVVFFSSFEYEGQVYEAWKSSGILTRILQKKHLFREPRSNVNIEKVLREYKESIISSSRTSKEEPILHGALLLAIVGGKISEGINFSDGFGRCIVMVGLPYPSLTDVELMERVRHLDGLGKSTAPKPTENDKICSGFEILRRCNGRGKEYYENLCMKAVEPLDI
ncbi:DNA repair helicase UVH6 [Acorus calamus]|uniref:DNA repair helicase UVH6 n=1 Tax=Acorus calamus TaxID=4465 RepID=A0AAV9EGR6_ACOCL|nr:DNA repair helicase UVH6 [Acorus calamus]